MKYSYEQSAVQGYVGWWQNYTEVILATCASTHITHLQLQLSYLQYIHSSERKKNIA